MGDSQEHSQFVKKVKSIQVFLALNKETCWFKCTDIFVSYWFSYIDGISWRLYKPYGDKQLPPVSV